MEYILPLVTLAAVQLLAVISPGQSFVVVSKLALSSGRGPALVCALGIGIGSLIWSGAVIVGLAVVLQTVTWLYTLLKVAGGLYLLYLAVMLWRHADQPLVTQPGVAGNTSVKKALMTGAFTQLANPKVAVFFGSIFFALLPVGAPLWVYVAAVILVCINEILWYGLVALAFSVERSRNVYLRARIWIDRAMAGALALLGLRLIFDGQLSDKD